MMKGMRAEGVEWGRDWRPLARQAVVDVLQGQMAQALDLHLEQMAHRGEADRRNGSYPRHLLSELGDIELAVPRTRTYNAGSILRAYAQRVAEVDRLILACFVLGVSTRKVGKALLPILGRPVSSATVSRVAKTLDASVAAFHARPLKDQYRVLMLDGVVLARRTGAGAVRRPVLVALGIRQDGRKEVIDFQLATAESGAQWEQFLTDLYKRGLTGEHLELICVDGGSGLLAALPTVFAKIPVQRCWAHKIRNILNKVRRADQAEVKQGLHAVMNAKTRPQARSAARRFADRWDEEYPAAVACLRNDLDELLACFCYPSLAERKTVRTTNAIERRFVEVRRRTRPMGVFADRTSMDRILFAVFTYENHNQGVSTPLLLTHNS
jgi:transposase-like protein